MSDLHTCYSNLPVFIIFLVISGKCIVFIFCYILIFQRLVVLLLSCYFPTYIAFPCIPFRNDE
jgi:hypothetical protein